MKRLVAIAMVLATTCFGSLGGTALAQSNSPWGGWLYGQQRPDTPHPAVARVIVPENDGTAYGSGTLIGHTERLGLVITNWHVVRGEAGTIMVVFPDGFRSAARVLRSDRDWDLAALAIWRPRTQPVTVSGYTPQPGETLTIAGYGQGQYRASSGRVTQYVAPGSNFPFEIVEVSTGAREGDSGGPILNARGELAGVLFGSSFNRTMGSYSGRVRAFLGTVLDEFQRLDPGPSPTMVAGVNSPAVSQPVAGSAGVMTTVSQSQPRAAPVHTTASVSHPRQPSPPPAMPQPSPVREPEAPVTTVAMASSEPASTVQEPVAEVASDSSTAPVVAVAATGGESRWFSRFDWTDWAGKTRGEQIRNALAGLGVVLLSFKILGLFSTFESRPRSDGTTTRRRRSRSRARS